tara:strand:+ start:3247 stop:3825 length:579 start_codon:yes stop_codon:yes gene_type:complete
MSKVQIFNESIIIDNFFNPEVDNEILEVLKNYREDKGVLKSNVGGFQSDNIMNKIICDNLLQKCVKCITDTYNLKIRTKFELSNLWINKNKKNEFNLPHIHPNAHFSGVYYLEVSKDYGEIIFFREGGLNQLGFHDFIDSRDFNDSYTIKPQKGMLIIFPSSLRHMVAPHFEDIERISVSFNIGLSHEKEIK